MYKTIILPVFLYECETWFLALMEENSLKVLENRALRRTFGPRSDEVTGGWRKLHNELYNMYALPSLLRMIIKSRRLLWARHL
jgi:hypothetical protein